MNRLSYLLIALPAFTPSLPAASYHENMEALAPADPEFVLHMDLENDFSSMGAFLTELYMGYLQSAEDAPPIPIDFGKLFDRLGLGNLESMTMVSSPAGKGGFLNQSLFRFDGAPDGLFLLTGSRNEVFSLRYTAPADADFLAEFTLDGVALYGIIRNLVTDIMGPLGEGILEGQMSQPVNEEGRTLQEIINRLQTRVQIGLKPNYEKEAALPGILGILQGHGVVRLSGLGDLLPDLAPFLMQIGFTAIPEGNGYQMVLPLPEQAVMIPIFIETEETGNALFISFSEGARTWFTRPDETIPSRPEFLEAVSGLPQEGVSLWFSSKRLAEWQIDNLDEQLGGSGLNAGLVAPLQKLMRRFSGPQAGCAFLEEDAYRVISWQPLSYKTNLAVAGLAVPFGFGLAALEGRQTETPPAEEEETTEEGAAPSPSE